MDDVKIPQQDQERIDGMVMAYRNGLENLYKVAYLQGQIEQQEEEVKKLRERAAA